MTAPTWVSSILPGLNGHGIVLAAPTDATQIRVQLAAAGFTVVEARLDASEGPAAGMSADSLDSDTTPTSLRAAQAAIASALRLPETASHNLDAMVDSLRDLAVWWPESPKVVLLLHGAESLVESDLPGWHTLTEILATATQELWRGGGEGDRVFETVALVDRHGVQSLPDESRDQG